MSSSKLVLKFFGCNLQVVLRFIAECKLKHIISECNLVFPQITFTLFSQIINVKLFASHKLFREGKDCLMLIIINFVNKKLLLISTVICLKQFSQWK